jgi:hypothetical protein
MARSKKSRTSRPVNQANESSSTRGQSILKDCLTLMLTVASSVATSAVIVYFVSWLVST